MYTYGPRKATIKKYVLVANEIQNHIIKNNGKLDYGYYNDIVKKNSITGRFITDWVKLNLLLRVGKGIYKPVHTPLEPIHIRRILTHRNKLQTNYSLQARLANTKNKNVKNNNTNGISEKEFLKSYPKESSYFPHEKPLTGFTDPFAFTDLPESFDLPKAPTYNYVKPEKQEKKQKSFSLFWGLITIKF